MMFAVPSMAGISNNMSSAQLFNRFISENFASYIEADDDNITYADLPDSVITPDIKDDAVKTKGYFIYPSQLFANIAKDANTQ